MYSLSNKSATEISELLDEFGIKHGPVVDSTRSLYEKKLKEAMAKGKRPTPSSDKTFYREEEEEVTYVYKTPSRSDFAGERTTYMRSRPDWTELEQERSFSDYSRSKSQYSGKDFVDEPYMYETPSTYRNCSKSTPVKSDEKVPKSSSRLIPLWVQFVFFLAVAFFLYVVFSYMETNDSLKGIE